MLECRREPHEFATPGPEKASPCEVAKLAGHVAVMAAHVAQRQSPDQLPDGLDIAPIYFDPGERKLGDHKVEIVAVERDIVRQVGDGKIEYVRGDRSCYLFGAAQCARVFVWHTHVMQWLLNR
jgi:hypothetical protein